MGADLSNSTLEWAKPKDLKTMDTESQWIHLCVMSSEQDSNSIDAMIEDMADSEKFHGTTTVDDLFDEAMIDPINYNSKVCIKTNISLNRDCGVSWDRVTGKLSQHTNSIAVCLFAMNKEDSFREAERLLCFMPEIDNQAKIFPVYVRNAKANDQVDDEQLISLASQYNRMMVSAKVGDPSSLKLHTTVLKRLIEITMGDVITSSHGQEAGQSSAPNNANTTGPGINNINRALRPASHDARKDASNREREEMRESHNNMVQSFMPDRARHNDQDLAQKLSDFAYKQTFRNGESGLRANIRLMNQNNKLAAAQTGKQQAHSQTRDLAAMGLLTQVQKGQDARMLKLQQKQPGGANDNGGAQQNRMMQQQQQQQHAKIGAATNQPPKLDLKMMGNQQLQNQNMYYLIKPQSEALRGRKTLILDIDETLVHSSFSQTDQADIILPIDIEGRSCNIYIQVRPNCCEFIQEVGQYYEVVIFTASLSKYAIPLMNILDPQGIAPQRLFREHCTFFNGQFVKDMQRIGRRMEDIIIIDNSPNCYQFQPENGLPIVSWYDDPGDNELMRYVPALKFLAQVDDVRPVIVQSVFQNVWDCDLSIKICESLLIIKQQQQEQQYRLAEEAKRVKQRQQVAQKEMQKEHDENQVNQVDDRKSGLDIQQEQQQESVTVAIEERDPSQEAQKLQEPSQMIRQMRRGEGQDMKDEGDQMPALSNVQTEWVAPAATTQESAEKPPQAVQQKDAFVAYGSGKKAQPKQARSSSKPKTYEVNQGVIGANKNILNNQNQNTIRSSHENQESSQNKAERTEHKDDRNKQDSKLSKQNLLYSQESGNQIAISQSNVPSKQAKSIKYSSDVWSQNKPGGSNNDQKQSARQIFQTKTSTISNAKSVPKKVATSFNPQKLKEYLLSSQQDPINQSKVPQKVSSRNHLVAHNENNAPASITPSSSQKNINTVTNLANNKKQISLNNNRMANTSDGESRKANITFQNQPQTLTMKQPSANANPSIKNGSKRRANSNHTVDKKVNLDKFLSVVQQRSNKTPSNAVYSLQNGTSGRMAPQGINHLYKSSEQDKKIQFNSNNNSNNPALNSSSRNFVERKKIGSMRQGHNATDLVMAQKKLSLKVDREQANKTSGVRGIQLNQNDIVFSKTMNLSQFLSQQTKQVSPNGHGGQQFMSTYAKQQRVSAGQDQAQDQQSSNRAKIQPAHKRQKSSTTGPKGTQTTNVIPSSNSNWSSSLHTKPIQNSYLTQNANTIQQLMSNRGAAVGAGQNDLQQDQTASGNPSHNTVTIIKGQGNSTNKLNSSHQSLKNQKGGGVGESSQLQPKRMSAGNIVQSVSNPSRSQMQTSNSLNSRIRPHQTGSSNSKVKGLSKKINQSSSMNPTERDNAYKVQAFLDDSSQQFINATGKTQAHSLTRSNQDYQRSPGQIFKGSSNAQALIAASSQTAKNVNNKVITYVNGKNLQGKRQSKPQLMSELTLSLKNKKNSVSKQTQDASTVPTGYSSNLIANKGSSRGSNNLVPGQTVNKKASATSNLDGNFVSRSSYTQRVGAANAVANGFLAKNQFTMKPPELEQQQSANSSRKKVIKLVTQTTSSSNAQIASGAMSLKQTAGPQTTKNVNTPGVLDSSQNMLLNNYYQNLHKNAMSINSKDKKQDPSSGVPQHEIKQRQQIFSMLSDFEKTSKFNKEQIKNFSSPKGGAAQVTNNLRQHPTPPQNSKERGQAATNLQIGGKKPKIRTSSSHKTD